MQVRTTLKLDFFSGGGKQRVNIVIISPSSPEAFLNKPLFLSLILLYITIYQLYVLIIYDIFLNMISKTVNIFYIIIHE